MQKMGGCFSEKVLHLLAICGGELDQIAAIIGHNLIATDI